MFFHTKCVSQARKTTSANRRGCGLAGAWSDHSISDHSRIILGLAAGRGGMDVSCVFYHSLGYHFLPQGQYMVKLQRHFAWQGQYLVKLQCQLVKSLSY